MNDFNLDQYKEDFKQLKSTQKDVKSIEKMLNKSSIDNAKYILIISIVEFIILLLLFTLDIFTEQDMSGNPNYNTIPTETIENISRFTQYFRIAYGISLVISLLFIFTFSKIYKKLRIDTSIKQFTNDILQFRKTANYFIYYNVGIFILFWTSLTFFMVDQIQKIAIAYDTQISDNVSVTIFSASFVLFCIIMGLITIYYRYFWGMFLRRLKNNQKELQEVEHME